MSDPDRHIDPTRAQFEAFKGLDRDEPCEMLNLVRLRDLALYPDGHPLPGTGQSRAEADVSYGRDSGPVLARVGGQILWRGTWRAGLIGPSDEH